MNIKKVVRTWETKKGVKKSKDYYYQFIEGENNKKGKWISIDDPNQVGYNRSSKRIYNKKGELTKFGKAYVESIRNDKEMTEIKKEFLLTRLEVYAKEREKKGKAVTLASFQSHIANTQLERMIYNLGTSAEEIAEQTGYDVDEVLKPENWDFENNVFKDFTFEFDYDEYYGYKLTRRA